MSYGVRSLRSVVAASDLCAAVVVAVVGILITVDDSDGVRAAFGMLLVALPLLVRRRSVVLASAGFVLVGVWATGLLFGVEVRCGAQLIAMAYLAFWAGRTFDRGQLVRWSWLVPLFLWGEYRFDPVMSSGGFIIGVPMLAGSVGLGLLVRGVDRRARHLDEAVKVLRRERTHTAALAATAERLRVHEQLHSVVDARLTEILELAVVGETAVGDRLAAVERTAGAALERLQAILLDLRAPAPGGAPVVGTRLRSARDAARRRWGRFGTAALVLLCAAELTDLLRNPATEGSLVPLPVRERLSISLATAALVVFAAAARRWPVASVILQSTIGPILIVTGPEVDYLPTTCLLAIAVVAYTTGLRLGRRFAIAGLALMLCTWLTAEFGFGAGEPMPAYAILGPWLAGQAMQLSRRLVDQLQTVHAELETERARQVDLATQIERRHLVGEVHDVLGGALSVILVQAAGGRRLAGADPDAAAGATRTITDTVVHARRHVTALRMMPGTSGQSETVEDVLQRMRQAGMSIRVVGSLSSQGWPAEVTFVLARLVQESLTNALRHAPGANVTITVGKDGADLTVAIASDAASAHSAVAVAGTGLGLTAMADRLATIGGEMTAGATGDGWTVRARIPVASTRPLLTTPA